MLSTHNLTLFRNDAILKWLKTHRRTLTTKQEKKIGGRQVCYGKIFLVLGSDYIIHDLTKHYQMNHLQLYNWDAVDRSNCKTLIQY